MEEFANEFSAGIQKVDVDTYKETHEKMLERLNLYSDIAENLKEPENWEEFFAARRIKSMLSSLYCYSFNNQKEEFEKVAELENKIGVKMYKFCKQLTKQYPSEAKSLARYILWSKYYSNENLNGILDELCKYNMLFKETRKSDDDKDVIYYDYYAVGLHLATGDNTFTVSHTGQQYRNYIKTCVPQAFYIQSPRIRTALDKRELPELDKTRYEVTMIGDHKYGVKISFSRQDHRVLRKYRNFQE